MRETPEEFGHNVCIWQPVLRGSGRGMSLRFGITICGEVKQESVILHIPVSIIYTRQTRTADRGVIFRCEAGGPNPGPLLHWLRFR
jgi:hypothetical protein